MALHSGSLGDPQLSPERTQINYLNLSYLHLLHKLAVVRLHKVCLQVESTTNPGVGDHRSEDL